jgi:hypothetical protein
MPQCFFSAGTIGRPRESVNNTESRFNILLREEELPGERVEGFQTRLVFLLTLSPQLNELIR